MYMLYQCYLDQLGQDDVVELVGHGISGVNVLHVIVVQFHVGCQRQGIGRRQMLLVGFVVQLVTLQ